MLSYENRLERLDEIRRFAKSVFNVTTRQNDKVINFKPIPEEFPEPLKQAYNSIVMKLNDILSTASNCEALAKSLIVFERNKHEQQEQ